jgi:hypothetical protein
LCVLVEEIEKLLLGKLSTENERLGAYWNGVDRNSIASPPFPPKSAERVGHGSLQQKRNASKQRRHPEQREGSAFAFNTFGF